ncbi:MAG: hypothetical protein V1647_02795 [Pseudomonadota bacterium]
MTRLLIITLLMIGSSTYGQEKYKIGQFSSNVTQDQVAAQTEGWRKDAKVQSDFYSSCTKEVGIAKNDPNYFSKTVDALINDPDMTSFRRSVLTQSLGLLLEDKNVQTKIFSQAIVLAKVPNLTAAITTKLEDAKKVVKAQKQNDVEMFLTDIFFSGTPAQQYDRQSEHKVISFVYVLKSIGVAYGEGVIGQKGVNAIKEVALADVLSPLSSIAVDSLQRINGKLSQDALASIVGLSYCEDCVTKGDPIVPNLKVNENREYFDTKMIAIVVFLAEQKRADLVANIYNSSGSLNNQIGIYSPSHAVKNAAAQLLGKPLPYPNEEILTCINTAVETFAYLTYSTAVPVEVLPAGYLAQGVRIKQTCPVISEIKAASVLDKFKFSVIKPTASAQKAAFMKSAEALPPLANNEVARGMVITNDASLFNIAEKGLEISKVKIPRKEFDMGGFGNVGMSCSYDICAIKDPVAAAGYGLERMAGNKQGGSILVSYLKTSIKVDNNIHKIIFTRNGESYLSAGDVPVEAISRQFLYKPGVGFVEIKINPFTKTINEFAIPVNYQQPVQKIKQF